MGARPCTISWRPASVCSEQAPWSVGLSLPTKRVAPSTHPLPSVPALHTSRTVPSPPVMPLNLGFVPTQREQAPAGLPCIPAPPQRRPGPYRARPRPRCRHLFPPARPPARPPAHPPAHPPARPPVPLGGPPARPAGPHDPLGGRRDPRGDPPGSLPDRPAAPPAGAPPASDPPASSPPEAASSRSLLASLLVSPLVSPLLSPPVSPLAGAVHFLTFRTRERTCCNPRLLQGVPCFRRYHRLWGHSCRWT
mmetsp:Transcript_18212/g.54752  ORF Transcript_18212/g.54752 Transcript_18212/m.54752 type:complete len:250 (-) Transcript_18212:786-1535(-)